jgi:hypothetical protein
MGGSLITDDTIFYGDEGVIPFQIRSKIIKDIVKEIPGLEKAVEGKESINIADVGWLVDLTKVYLYEKRNIEPSKLFYVYAWNSDKTKIQDIEKKEMLSRLIKVYKTELSSSIWFKGGEKESLKRIFKQYGDFVDKVECKKVFVGHDPIKAIKSITGKTDAC